MATHNDVEQEKQQQQQLSVDSNTPVSEKLPSDDSVAQDNSVSDGYRKYVLILLTIVYAFNFIDRQIIGILSPFIQADLGLTDAQLGWLKGIYFALLYTIVGIPIAWLADRYNRVNIIAISLTLWSGFTALSGMATSYTQLALARIGVGIGEAGGSPPSHSIISSLYPKEERASALAIYSLGIPFGIMAAYFASAFFLQGGTANWRIVLLAVGLPGIALAILLKLTVKEPGREITPQQAKESSWDAIKTLLSIKSWWGMCLAISFASFGNYAISAWMMDFYVRGFAGLNITHLLVTVGIINGIVYSAGVWIGGSLVDKLSQKNRSAYGYVPAITLMIGAPAFILSLYVGSLNASLALLAILLFTSGFNLGPSFAIAQTLSPVKVRAMSTAMFFFVLNIIALGGGPTFIGLLSDSLSAQHGAVDALRISLSWLAVPYLMSIICFFWSAKQIPRDWDKAVKENG